MIVSVAWVAAKIGARQLANALLFFWLAYKLPPGELGVAALGVALAMFSLPMVVRGMREVVIQREKLDERILSSAFVLNLCLGLVLWLGLMLLAPVLAPVFGDPRLAQLAMVAAVIPLLAAVASLQESLCERAFDYKRITAIYAAGAAVAGVLAVAVTLAGAAIWALVVFNVVSYTIMAALMWLKGPWRMRARPDPAEMLVMLRFAAPVMISQTLAIGGQRIVEVLVGALLTPAAAAFMRFGGNFIRLLNQTFVTPVIQVLMPAFARSKASSEHNLVRVLAVNGAILFFVFMLAAALLPGFIEVVFGEKWAIGGQVATVMCFGIYATLIGPVAFVVLISRGHGDWTVIFMVVELITIVVFVSLGAQFGAVGAALGFISRAVVTVPLILWVLRRTMNIAPRVVLGAFLPFAVAGTLVYLGMRFAVLPLTAALPYPLALALQIVIGLVLYLALLRFGVRPLAPQSYGALREVVPARLRRLM